MSTADEQVSGVRAARLRLGMSQSQLAERMQFPLDSIQNWDRGRNYPNSPAKLQLLSIVLETPLDVLFDPADDAHVARVLRELEQARETEPANHRPTDGSAPDSPGPESAGQPRRRRARAAILGIAAVGITTGLVAAIVLVGGSDNRSAIDGRDAGAAQLVRQDREARVDMDAAASRGDFDRAIDVATRAGDDRAAAQYKTSAAAVLVRRAAAATSRGDLPLARKRLRSARQRYGTAPGAKDITTRMSRIERDRSRRAVAQRQRARRQESASTSPAPTTPAPSVPAPTSPATPAPSPTPSPRSTPKPSRDREQAVDPGLF